MARYDKYIDYEFTFQRKDDEIVYMNYTGVETNKNNFNGFCCAKCDKPLKSKAYAFTGSKHGEEWLFGSDCVKSIFGAGLVTLKESQKQDKL